VAMARAWVSASILPGATGSGAPLARGSVWVWVSKTFWASAVA